MDAPITLAEKLTAIDEPWSPRIVATYNENKVVVVKAEGEFVWHSHPETDDLFVVLAGRLSIDLREGDGERTVELGPGQLYVVPRGVEHRPRAQEGAHALLIEPLGTTNTGDAGGELTAPERFG